MCNVNYLTELRRFHTFAARTGLPASAQLLWYKLVEIINQTAHGADWCDGFLRIDNSYLLTYFPMSATALADARRTLCEYGLLEYIPGEKKRTPPAYRLHYFSTPDGESAIEAAYQRRMFADCPADSANSRANADDSPVDCHADCTADSVNSRANADDSPADCTADSTNSRATPDYPSVYPSDCTTDYPADNPSNCTTDCHGNSPESRDTNINDRVTDTETKAVTQTGEPSDDEINTSAFFAGYAGACAHTGADAYTGAREDAVPHAESCIPHSLRERAKLTSKVLLHQAFTEEQLNRVAAVYARYGFEDGLIIQAIAKTAEANPTNAVNYLLHLLTDWGDAGVRTVADMEDFLYARDAALGNAYFHTREEGQAMMTAFKARHGAA